MKQRHNKHSKRRDTTTHSKRRDTQTPKRLSFIEIEKKLTRVKIYNKRVGAFHRRKSVKAPRFIWKKTNPSRRGREERLLGEGSDYSSLLTLCLKKKITFYDFETERIIKTEIKFKHPNGVIYIYDLIFVFDFRNQNRMTTMRFLVKTEQTTRPMDIFYL